LGPTPEKGLRYVELRTTTEEEEGGSKKQGFGLSPTDGEGPVDGGGVGRGRKGL